MKTLLQGFVLCVVLTFGVSSMAQVNIRKAPQPSTPAFSQPVKRTIPSEFGESTSAQDYFPSEPLSTLISIPGASKLPVTGRFYNQTNGRGLHNIQIDPSNPLNVHAVIMTATSIAIADTIGGAYPSRRCLYSFSRDGGVTWGKTVALGNVRTGFPDMILVNRNGKYVPIIAAHRYEGTSTGIFVSAIYIEKGAPGDGSFKEVLADRHAIDGSDQDLLWPTIAVSKDGKKIFMIADFSNQANPRDQNNMEFGSFTMSTDGLSATFDGWKASPGAGMGDTKGWCQSGAHRIQVSSDGTIGVCWINSDGDTPDHSMYFLESKDGGGTWPSTFVPLIPSALDQNNFRAVSPSNGIDFFYNGTTPIFTWQAEEKITGPLHGDNGSIDSGSYYFPYTGQLFYWSKNSPTVQCLNSKSPGYTISFMRVLGDSIGVSYPYTSDYFDPSLIPASGIAFPEPSTIAYPTFVRTKDPNVYGIFYQTVVDNDNTNVNDVTNTQWFTSIFYQWTKDGGATWTAPAAFKSNPADLAIENHLDYRYPQASSFSNSANFQIGFSADSSAGGHSAGQGGWSDITWWWQTLSIDAVHNGRTVLSTLGLGQNYPNPVSENTVIPVDLVNSEFVTLTLEDVLGRSVKTIFSGTMTSGSHNVSLSSASLAPGVYRYTIRTRTESDSRLLMIVR